MKVVTDLSGSFNPVPKTIQNKKKSTAETGRKTDEVKPKIKQKSKKLAKLEKDRFSILTDNLEKCYFCRNKKMELHEAFRGRNRQKSMKWGLVVPICHKCHSKITTDKEFSKTLEQIAKTVFVKKYSEEKFIEEFK